MKSLRSPRHIQLLDDLRALRKAADVTQQALAERMNRPQSFVAKIEGGERRLDVVELIAWLEALGAQSQAGELLGKLFATPSSASEQQSLKN